eukprot:SAG31_NODE_22334_length_527_cov_19.098131_1_plen_80_part_10
MTLLGVVSCSAVRTAHSVGYQPDRGGREVAHGTAQLFFDSRDISSVSNIKLQKHAPTVDENPVLVPETKWEGGRFNYYHS